MAKYTSYNTKADNRFRNLIIGIVGAIVLLGISLLVINALSPNPLREDNIYKLAENVYGNRNSDEYLIYFYAENCSYCQQLNESAEFNYYISNPAVPLYKLDVYAIPDSVLRKGKITATPTILHMKKTADGKYEIYKTLSDTTSIRNYLSNLY